MIVATLVGWGIFAMFVMMDMTALFDAPPPVRVLLGILTTLSAIFAAIMTLDALSAFRRPVRSWLSRIGGLAVAAAAIGLTWLFYMFDITNFSTNW